MTRVAFQLQVRPELLDEYLARHSPVWPEMLAEIAAAGRRNYSLFLAEGGTLLGYYETDDDAAAQAYLARSGAQGSVSVNAREVSVSTTVDYHPQFLPVGTLHGRGEGTAELRRNDG